MRRFSKSAATAGAGYKYGYTFRRRNSLDLQTGVSDGRAVCFWWNVNVESSEEEILKIVSLAGGNPQS